MCNAKNIDKRNATRHATKEIVIKIVGKWIRISIYDHIFYTILSFKLKHEQCKNHRRAAYSICESSFLIHHGFYHDLIVCPW